MDIQREDLEAAVYNMYGMLRVFIPGNQKGMTDAKEFIEKQKPMIEEINKKIRHNAVERAVAWLGGQGYVFTPDQVAAMKEAATSYRKKELQGENVLRNVPQ